MSKPEIVGKKVGPRRRSVVRLSRKRFNAKWLQEGQSIGDIPTETIRKKLELTSREIQRLEQSISKFEKRIDREYSYDPEILGMHFA